MPPPIEPIARKCLDAFALFRYGKTHDEWVADNENQQPQEGDKGKPYEGHESLTGYLLSLALRAGLPNGLLDDDGEQRRGRPFAPPKKTCPGLPIAPPITSGWITSISQDRGRDLRGRAAARRQSISEQYRMAQMITKCCTNMVATVGSISIDLSTNTAKFANRASRRGHDGRARNRANEKGRWQSGKNGRRPDTGLRRRPCWRCSLCRHRLAVWGNC